MPRWDRLTADAARSVQDAAVRRQVADAVAPFSPFWRTHLRALGVRVEDLDSAAALERIPAVGERDVCTDGDPAAASALVLQSGEVGWALHADGPRLRSGLARRATRSRSYRRHVDAETRPVVLSTSGLGVRFPVASTRADLDVLARVGARTWSLLELTRRDVLVSGLPQGTTEARVVETAALGAGSPTAAPGPDPAALAEAVRLLHPTVLALPSATAATTLADLAERLPLRTLAVVLLVGAPLVHERRAVRDVLVDAGARQTAECAVHVPAGSRLPWVECRPGVLRGGGAGLHSFPDLEVVSTVDPETGESSTAPGPLEPVTTSLGLAGTALLRWRTGDLVDAPVRTDECPGCRRVGPRVDASLRRGALVPPVAGAPLDLRSVTGALAGRPDATDWRVVLAPSRRSGDHALLVHLAASARSRAAAARGAVLDVAEASGHAPAQVVLSDDLEALPGRPLTRRVLVGADADATRH